MVLYLWAMREIEEETNKINISAVTWWFHLFWFLKYDSTIKGIASGEGYYKVTWKILETRKNLYISNKSKWITKGTTKSHPLVITQFEQ